MTTSLAFAAAAAGLIAAAMVLLGGWSAWRLERLSESQESDANETLISVVIPARDEAQYLEASVRSLLAQQDVDLEVIVVNDHSSDATGAIADALAAEDERVRILHDPELRPGWLGKVNAMQHGLDAARGPLVLLSDADIDRAPRCLASALSVLRQRDLDLLTLIPEFRCESFWESVLIPQILVAGYAQLFGPAVNDPRSKQAVAAGAFILVRREVLETLGGLKAIRSNPTDDVALAQMFKRNGRRMLILQAADFVSVRLFHGNRHAFWGLTKNILIAVDRLWLAPAAMLLPFFVYWTPLIALAVGAARGDAVLAAVGFAGYAASWLALVAARLLCGCRFAWAAASCFPLAAVPVALCFAIAIYHRLVGGAVSWRGRVIALQD